MKTYSILNPGQVFAGEGSINELANVATACQAKQALIISDQGVAGSGLIDKPKSLLESAGLVVRIIDDTPPEPTVEEVKAILAKARMHPCDLVIGLGGGSAMDTAKLVAVLLANALSVEDLLAKRPIPNPGICSVMIPTTAGTGSEATPNSIVLVPEEALKVGIVSLRLMPRVVILDPQMTITLPPAITASTGMDALTHAIECLTSKKGNPFSELYALKAITLISENIRQAFHHGEDLHARHQMMLGAYYGGLCIATSSTTAVHALAYPLGGKFRMAHGISNAILLPYVMRFNCAGNEALFRQIAAAMGINISGMSDRQAAERMIEALFALNRDLGIPANLAPWKITHADLDTLVEGAATVTRLLDNNPRPMSRDDIHSIYTQLI